MMVKILNTVVAIAAVLCHDVFPRDDFTVSAELRSTIEKYEKLDGER